MDYNKYKIDNIENLEIIPIAELREQYPKLHYYLHSHCSVEQAMSLMLQICPHCYESLKPCHCMNDE